MSTARVLKQSYGTNTRVWVVAAGDHGHSEEDLRYVRRYRGYGYARTFVCIG